MNRSKSTRVVALNVVSVLLQGSGTSVPTALPPQTGLLVFREDENVISYWDKNEWVPLNQTGFFAKFACDMPSIPVGNWGLIQSPSLDVTADGCYVNLSPGLLMMAIHMASVEVFQPRLQKEPAVSDQSTDPEFADVREDVDDYVRQVMADVERL